MIVLLTDFGLAGPYIGQMKVKIYETAPDALVVDLFADLPAQNPKAAAYLLAAYADAFSPGAIFLCVVDPGVGGDRPATVVEAGGRWFVGPGNGLFELVMRRFEENLRVQEIDWPPDNLSASFHGRDIFAPVAARVYNGDMPPVTERPTDWMRRPDWPDDLPEIVYIDHFGNAITGLRASCVNPSYEIAINNVYLKRASTYSEVPLGRAFWYENSNGLVEVSVNQGSSAKELDIKIGTKVKICDKPHS